MLFERKKKHCQKNIQLNQKYLTLIFLVELDQIYFLNLK
jgi:hypothetical protein